MPRSSHAKFILAVALGVVVPPWAHAQRGPAPVPPATSASPERPATPIPPEKNSATQHELSLGGKTLRYTATAGNLLIEGDDEQTNASVFYAAYTLDGVTDPRTRPVTFLYNGGPGSASMWLHMGSVGPVRVVTSSPEPTGSGPYQVVPNEYSLLDKSDLVFIDAVGTGYSRPVGKGTIRDFAGTDQDVRLSEIHLSLCERQPPLELAQVSVRRILRHHALGRVSGRAPEQRHVLQRRHSDVFHPELLHAGSRLGRRFHRQPALLRRHRVALREGVAQG